MDIIKTVIPAAGFGTRFLPFTKAVPKEMLPLLNKPVIQYIIEEALLAQIRQCLIITSRSKGAIAHHFDASPELEFFLKEKNKSDLLSGLEKIRKNAEFAYIYQAEQLGLGHAIWLARHMIGKEYFAVMLPDDIIIDSTPGIAQLIRIARQEKASVIAIQEVPSDAVSSYGVIAIKKQITPSLYQVSDLVEKPQSKDAPSNLAIIGRYVLSHKIFASLEEIEPSAGGEIQLTDAISHLLKNNEKVFAYKIPGTRHDIGTPAGWLKATLDMALHDPSYNALVRSLLQSKAL